MKSRITVALLMVGVMGLINPALRAQDKPGLKHLGIDEVTCSKSVTSTVTASGQADSLNLLIDGLNQHLLVQFEQTNKFAVVGRSDLARLIKEQQIPVGMIRDPNEAKALPGQIKGLDYLVIATITDFKDAQTGMFVQAMNQQISVREVQATAVIKIYDTTTGVLRKSIDVPVRKESRGASRVGGQVNGNNAVDNSMVQDAAVELCGRAAARVMDLLYPVQVAQMQAGIVFVNRGEGGGIDRDQLWEVFATGPEIIDPGTGKSLGSSEVKVGEVVITDVLPNFSKARVLGSNGGIEIGSILRLKAPPAGGPAGPAQGMGQ
jgi:curli biogenesis system outer membrane secretion channel CsgG